jgi:hypothetical protein
MTAVLEGESPWGGGYLGMVSSPLTMPKKVRYTFEHHCCHRL